MRRNNHNHAHETFREMLLSALLRKIISVRTYILLLSHYKNNLIKRNHEQN
jgi:hypothetical protein